MSKTSTTVEFCELSLSHESTSNVQSPYPKFLAKVAFIGTYPTTGPLMQCATFRHLLNNMLGNKTCLIWGFWTLSMPPLDEY
jgi:hypothetical protein